MALNNFPEYYDFYGRAKYDQFGQRLDYSYDDTGRSAGQRRLSKEEQFYYWKRIIKEETDSGMTSFVQDKLKDNCFELYFFVGYELAYPGFLVTWNLLTMAPTDVCGILDTDKLPRGIFQNDAPIYEIDEVIADWLIENNHALFEDNMPKSKMINFIWSMISEYVIELSTLTAED